MLYFFEFRDSRPAQCGISVAPRRKGRKGRKGRWRLYECTGTSVFYLPNNDHQYKLHLLMFWLTSRPSHPESHLRNLSSRRHIRHGHRHAVALLSDTTLRGGAHLQAATLAQLAHPV